MADCGGFVWLPTLRPPLMGAGAIGTSPLLEFESLAISFPVGVTVHYTLMFSSQHINIPRWMFLLNPGELGAYYAIIHRPSPLSDRASSD